MTLRAFVAALWAEPVRPRPVNETWNETNRCIRDGGNQEVSEEVYRYYLEVLPPWFQQGSFFAFCEGREPLRLFDRQEGVCFCRLLTWEQTVVFCRLAGIALPS